MHIKLEKVHNITNLLYMPDKKRFYEALAHELISITCDRIKRFYCVFKR